MEPEMLKDRILLTKDGRAIFTDKNEENDKWESYEINEDYIFYHLHTPIVLEEGFTLRSYFYLIERYPLFKYADYFFDCFIEEFRNCPESGCTDPNNDIKYLSLNRIMCYEASTSISPRSEFHIYQEGLNSEGRLDVEESIDYSIDFHGVGEDYYYAIEFTSLDQLLDYELVLGNAKISIELSGDAEDYVSLKDKYIIRETEDNNYNLYEFVKEIIWELSFCGCPNKRDEIWEEIEDRVSKYNPEDQEDDGEID